MNSERNMEQAIQTVVGVFLKSANGKENVSGSDFKKLVKSKLQNIMSVREFTLLQGSPELSTHYSQYITELVLKPSPSTLH